MADSLGENPENYGVDHPEKQLDQLHAKLEEMLGFLFESWMYNERVQDTYKRPINQIRAYIAVKLKGALSDEFLKHELVYMKRLESGKERSLVDIMTIVDLIGSLKVRDEYIQKDNFDQNIFAEDKFRDSLVSAINGFLDNETNIAFANLAALASGYYQFKASQKSNYKVNADPYDLQSLIICKELDSLYEFYLIEVLHFNEVISDGSTLSDCCSIRSKLEDVLERMKKLFG
ncbi:hypothetical protein KKD70_05040 [Patescibacteria group bacterium]|nr:hypothetical protein [Patescibacteria group bacterium]